MILIVEDEMSHIELIRRAFEDAEDAENTHKIQVVSTIAAALGIIEQTLPDLVIIDLLLPDGRGTDILDEAREDARFPVVVMTSHGDEKVAVEAMKRGALDYVVKSPTAFHMLPRIALRSIREWGHIQARRMAEASVRQSEARLRAFLDAAAQGVIVMDEDGQIQYVNRQLAEMLGLEAAALLHQDISILFPEAHRADYLSRWRAYIAEPGDTPIRIGVEVLGRRHLGEVFPVSLSLNQMTLNGKTQTIALVADITHQKKLEAQAAEVARMERELEQEKQIRQYKDSFLSMMSHEFRTPLSVIRSSSDILKKHYDRLSEEKRQQNFHRIQTKVQELDEMISDILLLSKTEMNMLVFEPQPTNLHEFLNQLVDGLKNKGEGRILLDVSLSESTYLIDQYLLEHALNNLLGNALKYSPPESPIEFTVYNGANFITMEITDRGIGIPADEIGRIFEAFRRGSNANQLEGTGVGLAIVREFVELHRGTVSCQSQVNEGTTFRVEIPT